MYVCVDGQYSEDGLSSGGEFYDDNVEFRRPAPDIVIKSVPIVPSQQVSHSLISPLVYHSIITAIFPGEPRLADLIGAKGTGIRELMRGLVTLPPEVDPGAFIGQCQGWKTPRGPPGSALLLHV